MALAEVLERTLDNATPRSRAIFGGANAMSAQEVAEFIDEYPVALVSTVDASGAPHVTGKGVVLLNDRIYMGSSGDTAMGRNLRRNPSVAVAFAEPPWKHHVLLQGSARFLEEGDEEHRMVVAAHVEAHGWEPEGLAEIVPRTIFTWKD